jgi:hypothetical protein
LDSGVVQKFAVGMVAMADVSPRLYTVLLKRNIVGALAPTLVKKSIQPRAQVGSNAAGQYRCATLIIV